MARATVGCSSSWTTPASGSSAATAAITEASTGFPGYDGYIPFENGFLSEILHGQGYNTYAVGKWHLTPADQVSAAGPYDRWPRGDTHQYYPELVADNHRVEPERTPEEGYHLTEDLVDKATAFVADAKQVAPTSRSSCISPPGRCTPPTTSPRSGPTATKGSSTTAGTPTASRCSPARRSWASSRPTPSCRATTPTSPPGPTARLIPYGGGWRVWRRKLVVAAV